MTNYKTMVYSSSMKNTLSSLLPLASLIMGLSACPKPVQLTPPTGPKKIYHYERSDAKTNSTTGETIYTDTEIHGLDPYKIPGYGVESEEQAKGLLGEMVATIQRIETTCDLDLSRPMKNEIHISYNRADCQANWKKGGDPSCVNPEDSDSVDCEAKQREFFNACTSITNPSHPPELLWVVVAYPELTSTARACVEVIQAEKRCTIQSENLILEKYTDSGEFERGLRVICDDLKDSQ